MKDVKTLTGKMDMDSNPLYVNSGDYSYARNFRNNNKNYGGKHGNVLSFDTKYTGSTQDIVVGSVFDVKRDVMILFLYNTDPDKHRIILVDDQNQGSSGFVDTILFQSAILNFSVNERIKAGIVDDSLIWTDLNGVRLIDIPAALRTSLYTSNYLYSIRDFMDFSSKAVDDRVVYEGKVYKLNVAVPTTPPDGANYTYLYDYEIAYTQNVLKEFDESDLSFIALPPTNKPIAVYDNDYDYNQNNLYGRQFKFAYKLEYLDGRQSVWSPWSDVAIPYGEDNITGLEKSPLERNIINLSIDFGKINRKRLLTKVYIASWEQGDTAIKIIDELKVYNDDYTLAKYKGEILFSEFIYKSFYNNEIYSSEALSDFLDSYDYVPELTKHMQIIDDGRVLFGNMTEGFDLPKSDVEISVESSDIDVLNVSTGGTLLPKSNNIYYYDLGSGGETTSYFFEFPDGYQQGYTVNIAASITYGVTSGAISFSYTHPHNPNKTDADNLYDLIYNLSKKIREEVFFIVTGSRNPIDNSFYSVITQANFEKTAFPDFPDADNNVLISFPATEFSGLDTSGVTDRDKKIYITYKLDTTASQELIVDVTTLSYAPDISKYKSLQASSSYDIGIVYYDNALRSSGVLKLGKILTPKISYGEINLTSGSFKKLYIEATINHSPPLNATKYSFVITENSGISDYIWMCLDSDATSSGKIVSINISTPILGMNTLYPKSILQDWVFQKGDRIKVVAVPLSPVVVQEYDYTEILDTEILEQDDSTGIMKISHGSTIDEGSIVMVYRPRKSVDSENNVYREIGGFMDIVDGYHISNGLSGSQNQTSSLPAIVNIDYGDTSIHVRQRDSSNIFIVEDKNLSDFYVSDFTDLGRPQFYLPDAMRKNNTTRLRYGGKLLPNSNVNNIAKFKYEDTDVLSKEYGSVNGVVIKGFTLLVIQDTRVTSYYINKDLITKADGTGELTAVGKVLNNKRVSDYDYGCVNSESIIQKNNHVYFFDSINGCFVRHSDNGAHPISDYGINTFSKQIAEKQNISNENSREFWIHGGIDEYNNEVVWAVVWDNNITGSADLETESISFDTVKNEWRSFWDYKIDNFVYLVPSGFSYFRNKLCYFLSSSICFTETGNDYMPLTIEVICNQEPVQNKVFNYLTLESNEEMNNDSYDAVNVDNIMKTNIPVLKNKEGNWYTEFRRDSLTPMSGTQLDKARGGRRLRGKWMKVRLSTDVSTEVNINGVLIDSTVSNRL